MRLEHARQARQRGAQHGHHALQRTDDHAEDPASKLMGRGQAGELLDLPERQVSVPGETRLQDENTIGACVVLEGLGGGDRVGAKGDGGRALQVVDDAGAAGALGGKSGQGVLGDDVLDAQRAEAPAEVLQIGDRQAAVLGQNGNLRRGQSFSELVDRRALIASRANSALGHAATSAGYRAIFPMLRPRSGRGTGCLGLVCCWIVGHARKHAQYAAASGQVSELARARVGCRSRPTPGPMVEARLTVRMYWPLAPDGLARTTASTRALTFCSSWSSEKLTFPTGAWMTPVRSTRNSTRPPLISRMARPTSGVTVPERGLGISPRGPSTLPRRPTMPIRSGVATATSKSVQPPWMRCTRSSAPTISAPAASASRALSPVAKATTRTVRPVPAGSTADPRTCWSACFGSNPVRMCSSTDSSNLAYAASLTSL